MTSWYDAILSLCKNINSDEDVWTILDIVVDNGILGTVDAITLAKLLDTKWKPDDLEPLQEVAKATREALEQHH